MSESPLSESWSSPSAVEVATAAGADDLFVLRRIDATRFAHVGGVGRGAGWAGIVEIDGHELDRLSSVDGSVVRISTDSAAQVFGPYWATWVAAVPVDQDVLVIFGGSGTQTDVADEELERLASFAADGLLEVAPAKRLADELEVLTALQELLRHPPETTHEMLQRLADHATRALSCELGIAYLHERAQLAVCDLRGGGEVDHDQVTAAAAILARREKFPFCVQQAAVDDLPAPFSARDGVHSYYLLELRPPTKGILLLLHTTAGSPRGFTGLCQSLGAQLAEAAQPLLAAAELRDRMQGDLERATGDARRDPLTGLGNRLAWDENCAGRAAGAERPVAVVIVDGCDLKQINESYGYHIGDDVLRLLGTTLAHCIREGDSIARLGGDEFAILLDRADEEVAQLLVERIRRSVGEIELPDGPPVGVACGWAIDRQGDVAAAQRLADNRMIEDKGRRQEADRVSPPVHHDRR